MPHTHGGRLRLQPLAGEDTRQQRPDGVGSSQLPDKRRQERGVLFGDRFWGAAQPEGLDHQIKQDTSFANTQAATLGTDRNLFINGSSDHHEISNASLMVLYRIANRGCLSQWDDGRVNQSYYDDLRPRRRLDKPGTKTISLMRCVEYGKINLPERNHERHCDP